MPHSAFLDTNVLVYASVEDSPYHAQAQSVIERINSREVDAFLSLQVLAEFYATITNPRKMVRPLSPEEATEAVRRYLQSGMVKLHIGESTFSLTMRLAAQYQLKGPNIFDAQIAATMLDNGINTIITADEADFRRFEGIEVVNPFK